MVRQKYLSINKTQKRETHKKGCKKRKRPCTAEMGNEQQEKKKSPASAALLRVTGERCCCPNKGRRQTLGSDRLNQGEQRTTLGQDNDTLVLGCRLLSETEITKVIEIAA